MRFTFLVSTILDTLTHFLSPQFYRRAKQRSSLPFTEPFQGRPIMSLWLITPRPLSLEKKLAVHSVSINLLQQQSGTGLGVQLVHGGQGNWMAMWWWHCRGIVAVALTWLMAAEGHVSCHNVATLKRRYLQDPSCHSAKIRNLGVYQKCWKGSGHRQI